MGEGMKANQTWRMAGWSVVAIVLAVLMGTEAAWTQATGSISGRVDDPTSAAIPGAAVTVRNVETGATRTVNSDAAGLYRVLSLPVAQYEIRAEKSGFKAAVRRGIDLVVGQEAVINLSLEVGDVVQEVTIIGEAPLVNTTTASVSGLVGERQVKDLPLNGRSFDNLITLNASAINYTANQANLQTGTSAVTGNSFSVVGRRPSENLFLLNGIEYTAVSDIAVTPGGVSQQLLGIDAVREFNVVSDTYSAEYGKRAGAQVSIVTQSGTNQLHGTAFEFLRNSSLDARNFFDYPLGVRIPAFQRNQFGGSLGGPLRKDKMFLFGNYEGFRQRLGVSNVTVVPDQNARRGLLPNSAGVPAPVANLDSRMLPYMTFWPEPNGPNLGGGIALAYSNPKQAIREDFGTTRFDRTFSERDSFSSVYTVDDSAGAFPMTDPVFQAMVTLRSQVASVQETHVFSPQVLNTFRAGFSRAGFFYDTPPAVPLAPNLPFFTGRGFGTVSVGGGSSTNVAAITVTGSNGPNLKIHRNLFTYADDVQIVKGKHQISLGGWFQRLRSNNNDASRQTGRASFSTLQSFLQGTVSNFSGILNPTPMSWRQLEGAWYVQDAVTLRPNLTLRLGLRHEFTNGWNEHHGRAANYIYDPSGVLVTSTRVGDSIFTENNARWLFSPGVSLAWDPFGKGKTSIRTGLGIHYDLQDAITFIINSIPPYNGTITFLNASLPSIVPLSPSVAPPPTCGPTVPQPCTTFGPQGIQPNMTTPAVYEWNFSVEQQITPATAVRLGYVGSHGVHLLVSLDSNAIPSQICSNASGCVSGGVNAARGTVPNGAEYIPVGTRPNRFLANGFFWQSAGLTSYNALQAELVQRLARGLQFRANYTWSKSLDINAGGSFSQAQNQAQMVMDPYHPHKDWGPAPMDVAHKFTFSGNYELPLGKTKRWLNGGGRVAGKLASGWQLNAIVTLLTGFPFTPQLGANQSGNGDTRNPDRPSLNPSFTGPVILGTPEQWFNPKAFVLPTPGTFGNLGRGGFRGPGLATADLSLFKTTTISERVSMQFRAELFNVLNRANFGTPNAIVFAGSAFSPSAGLITGTATTSRQIQFGLKLIF